jgi:hypothetical protein
MNDYFKYLSRLIIPILAAFVFGWVLRSCEGKKSAYTPPLSVKEYIVEIDTIKQEVTKLKTRLKVVNVHDTIEVLQQVAFRDTIILKQDSVIVKQDTVIRYLIASDSLKTDTIQGLNKDVNRETFWKRFFTGAAAAGWLILLL